MKNQLVITVRNGKANVQSGVSLKDIVSTLNDGNYLVTIEPNLNADGADYYRKRFFAGIDTVVRHTAQPKESVKDEVTIAILRDLSKEGNALEGLVNLELIDPDKVFSLTWLNPLGWKEFYSRLKFWAHDKCDCYV